MQDLNDMLYFAEVADRGGFAAAGRALGIPKSKLSRRVAELESRLGVRLLQRWGVLPFSQELYDEGAVNRLLGWALRTEARWLRRRNLPWGASLFVVAQKALERG